MLARSYTENKKRIHSRGKLYRVCDVSYASTAAMYDGDVNVICRADGKRAGVFYASGVDLLVRDKTVLWESDAHRRARYACENEKHPELRNAPEEWWEKTRKRVQRLRSLTFPPVQHKSEVVANE